jgi:hypothetical protein
MVVTGGEEGAESQQTLLLVYNNAAKRAGKTAYRRPASKPTGNTCPEMNVYTLHLEGRGAHPPPRPQK